MTKAAAAAQTSGAPEPAPDFTRTQSRLVFSWIGLICGLLLLSLIPATIGRASPFGLTDVFLFEQDLPALVLGAAILLLWRLTPLGERLLHRFPSRVRTESQTRRLVGIAAMLVALFGLVGWITVYARYPLSMDEFLARFDATIFTKGQLVAKVAPEWRGFVPALTPMFRMEVPDDSFWASLYLPINAAFQALFSSAGSPALANAVWGGVAVVASFGVARRLWPERLDAAFVTAALLATSSQLLITGMTAYAMPAHLALNLVWLWLFLRGGRWGHIGASLVAFAACGLHQVVFHPMFAAPFVLQLWMQRRWSAALFQTLVYAAIGLFWVLYWSLLFHWVNAPPAVAQGVGGSFFVTRVVNLLEQVSIGGVGLMAKNLIRFVTWQNPLMIALAMLAPVAAWRAGGPIRSLMLGVMLTTLVMTVVLPYQGHGWGYRYLHGLMGSICLLAAFVWIRLTDGQPKAVAQGLWSGLALCSILSLLVLLPLRAYQVHSFIRPYAAAYTAIQNTDADFVVLNPARLFYAEDMTRNDPFLRNRPKIFDLPEMEEGQLAELCARGSVVLFDFQDGRAFGIRPTSSSDRSDPAVRQELAHPPCPLGRVKRP
ncbi:MAG: hypothetical protein ABIO39_13630 [Caulobacteraceae bacterium]